MDGRTPKYIFVTGGVVSSLGKGLAAASIGCLLEGHGYKVTSRWSIPAPSANWSRRSCPSRACR